MPITKPFKIVTQRDSMEGGVACLSMISAYYGADIPLCKISRFCLPTSEGLSMKGIVDAAQALGFNAYGTKKRIEQIKELKFPIILHWNQNHFVVLYKIDSHGKRFWIADPGMGKYKLSIEEFASHWLST